MTEKGKKRQYKRYTGRNLRIILKDDKNFRGEKLKDISLGGVFIRMDNPPAVGTVLELTLDPKLGIGDVKLNAEVIWTNTGGLATDRGMGVKFTEMPGRIKEKLETLFKTLTEVTKT
jgi:uncharacterized protein (TIGR02266 family)